METITKKDREMQLVQIREKRHVHTIAEYLDIEKENFAGFNTCRIDGL